MEYENRKAASAKWGLINREEKDRSLAARRINARAETVNVAPSFGEAYRQRRCVVPADGFYEWSGPKNKRMPQWLHRADGRLILLAGLYEAWTPEAGVSETTFTIITTTPNALIAPIHNRMPVVLSDRDADDWTNPRETNPRSLKRLLVPAADGVLEIRPASALVNSVKYDGPELLEANSSLAKISKAAPV
jgi:putative SOS response-associated peptidase YedK